MAHYKKNGSLDMRYTSSRAAVASQGFSSSSSSYPSSSHSSNTPSYGATALSYGSSSSSHAYAQPASASDSHYKKDGSLDMRFSSSKQAANASQSYGYSAYGSGQSSDSDLHCKKDGSLDMRYKSSKEAADASRSCSDSAYGSGQSSDIDLHRKKDGSLDMRYKSSKEVGASSSQVTDLLNKLSLAPTDEKAISNYGIPKAVQTTGKGLPDMRYNAAQQWVAEQATALSINGVIPEWVPRTKDGTVDISKALGRVFGENFKLGLNVEDGESTRDKYWLERIKNHDFMNELEHQRTENVRLPPPPPLICSEPLPRAAAQDWKPDRPGSTFSTADDLLIPDTVLQIDYADLKFDADEAKRTLGRGSFGVVLKARLDGKEVAVKQLHLSQLTRREREAFRTELRVLAHVGQHENLVALHGYCLEPLCLVMELVALGSLAHLLHYSEDPRVEANMSDGRVKKRLAYGIACGLLQLHAAKIVHGDIKPQNVLVTADYRAKVADFGLATLRGKTSSVVASRDIGGDGDVVGGTGGYMAPELLNSTSPPDYPSDVYSFGVLLNEVVCEQEPFYDQCANFAARGPFAAVNYALLGGRPTISAKQPAPVLNLIKRCWDKEPARRPTFAQIIMDIGSDAFSIVDSV